MKIEKLLAPKQEEIVTESDAGTSTAGSVASVNMPLGRVQRRGKGSMLQGIKTSAKFPNSKTVKEGAYEDGVNDGIRGEANPRASSIYGPESGEYSRGYKDGLVKGKEQQQQNIANYQAELAPYKEIETDELKQMLRDIRKRSDESQAIYDKYRGHSFHGSGKLPPNHAEMKAQHAIDLKAWNAIHQELFQRGVPQDQRMEEGVTEESSLQGIDPDFDKLLLRRAARRMGMTVPEYLHHLEKQKQDREHELSIGTQGRAELKQKADELAELRREKLRKERLEDEELAFQRAETIQQRKDEMQKIADKYKHDLKVIDTEHRNNMEAINTNNKFELDKLDKEYNDAQREREHQSGESDKEYRDRREQRQQELARERERQRAELDKAKIDAQAAVDAAQAQQPASQPFQSQTPPKQPRPRPSMGAGDMETPRPQRPQAQSQKPPMWHTSQQVGMNKPPKLGYNNDVTDVEPKPPKPGNMLALKEVGATPGRQFPEPRKPSFPGDHGSKSETMGPDGLIYHWQDPRAYPNRPAQGASRGGVVVKTQPKQQNFPQGINGDAKCRVCGIAYSGHYRFDAEGNPTHSLVRHPGNIQRDFPDLHVQPNTPVGEAKKANTKTARAEFGKRIKAKPSEKEQEQKKSESDRLWDMLQAHIAQAEKENKVDEASSDTTFNVLKGLKTWQVVIFNNYYAGKYSDYRGRYYYVLATSPQEAKQVVLDNADGILQELLAMKSQNGKKILPRSTAVRITPERIGKIEDGTVAGRMSTAGFKKMFGPQGPMMVKLSGGAVQDIQDPVVQGSDLKTVSKADLGQNKLNLPSGYGDVVQPQKVGEASFDYTMKDLGNDYAGFPSQHSLKHKFLAKIKPEKQQLYKDKMNNTRDWDSLFALFKVAKARGDIIESGTELKQPGKSMGLNASLDQHFQDKMHLLNPNQTTDEAVDYDKHSFIGKIRRGREADNKGWGQLGQLFAAGKDEKAAEKALRKGNRYYNMTRGDNKTPGGFPKTTIEEQDIDETGGRIPSGLSWTGGKLQKRPELVAAARAKKNRDAAMKRKALKVAQAVVNLVEKDTTIQSSNEPYRAAMYELGFEEMDGSTWWKMVMKAIDDINSELPQNQGVAEGNHRADGTAGEKDSRFSYPGYKPGMSDRELAKLLDKGAEKRRQAEKEKQQGVAEGSDDDEPFDYEEWKASTVKPRKPRGYKEAEFMIQQQKEINRKRKEQEQGVAEEKEKGADGKACWDGYRYNGAEDGKDSCVKVNEAEVSEDKLASDLYRDLQIFKKGADKEIGSKAKDKEISSKAKDKDIVAKEGFGDTIKKKAKQFSRYMTEPNTPHNDQVRSRAKNIAKIRKQEEKKSVFEKDPEAMREFERSGGYEAGIDVMGWQVGWAAAKHARGDTMKQAFQKLYYGGGASFPFSQKAFKLAWVAYNKHYGPQGNLEEMDGDGVGRDGSTDAEKKQFTAKPITSQQAQDKALDTLKKVLSKPENMAVLKRLKNK